MIRNHSNWLRFQVDRKMLQAHPELVVAAKNYRRRKMMNLIFALDNWFLILFATILCFLLISGLVAIIGFAPEKVDELIDQRAGNLSTISGMCLAVIAFLMTNIAIKEPYAYKVLFTKTRMYAAIFFVLTSLSCFLVASMFKAEMGSRWANHFGVASHVLFLLVLFVIGYLFSQAIRFTSFQHIDDFMNLVLAEDGAFIVYNGLLNRYSREIFQGRIKAVGGINYKLSDHFETSWLYENAAQWQTAQQVAVKESSQRYVKDINMILLAGYVQRFPEPVYFHMLAFNELTDQRDHYIFNPGQELTKEERKKQSKMLLLYRKKPELPGVLEIRAHFDDKIIQYSKNGQPKELERILNGLSALFALQLAHDTPVPFELTHGFYDVLRQALKESVAKNELACFQRLVQFFINFSSVAIDKENTHMLNSLLGFYEFIYQLVFAKKDNPDYREMFSIAMDPGGFYQHYFYYLAKMNEAPDKKLKALHFGEIIYSRFSMLLFSMISNKDFKGLLKAVKMLADKHRSDGNYSIKYEIRDIQNGIVNQQAKLKIQELRAEYRLSTAVQTYIRRTLFGIKAWTLYLLSASKLTVNEALPLIMEMQIAYIDAEDPLDDIFFFRSAAIYKGYLGWLSWGFADLEDDAHIAEPTYWLTFAFMIEQIRNYSLPIVDENLDMDNFASISTLRAALEAIKTKLGYDFTKWKGILRAVDESDFNMKADRVIAYFRSLDEVASTRELRAIADSDMDVDILASETQKAFQSWIQQSRMHGFFMAQGWAVEKRAVTMPFIIRTYGNDLKRFFVTGPSDISILTTFANDFARSFDDKFFDLALQGASHTIEEPVLIPVIERALTELQGRGIFADVILLDWNWLHTSALKQHGDFEEVPPAGILSHPVLFGHFRKIPVYLSSNPILKDRVIIGNFLKAFRLQYVKMPRRHGELLKIAVRALDLPKATLILDDKNPGLQGAQRERKLLEIQNRLHIEFRIDMDFNILDKEAYILGIMSSETGEEEIELVQLETKNTEIEASEAAPDIIVSNSPRPNENKD